jgi:hypothetical protein
MMMEGTMVEILETRIERVAPELAAVICKVVSASGDRVQHEIHESLLHRLVVNGVEGAWVGKAQVAGLGPYRATTEYFDSLPRVFLATDIQGPIALAPERLSELTDAFKDNRTR